MTKKTKKQVFKPVFVIDLTTCESAEDMYKDILYNKFYNRLPLTHYEVTKLLEYRLIDGLENLLEDMFDGKNALVIEGDEVLAFDAVKVELKEKQPWYKRLWNWLTRKK